MSHHRAEVHWSRRDGEVYTDRRYSRVHRLRFDGGAEVAGSASPQVVKAPLSDPAAVDPEEMFVASLASCHMLWFLDLACRAGWCIDSYDDAAEGVLAAGADGRLAITTVTLRPLVRCGGAQQPGAAELQRLHAAAHGECFIANSVRTVVRIEPRD